MKSYIVIYYNTKIHSCSNCVFLPEYKVKVNYNNKIYGCLYHNFKYKSDLKYDTYSVNKIKCNNANKKSFNLECGLGAYVKYIKPGDLIEYEDKEIIFFNSYNEFINLIEYIDSKFKTKYIHYMLKGTYFNEKILRNIYKELNIIINNNNIISYYLEIMITLKKNLERIMIKNDIKKPIYKYQNIMKIHNPEFKN